MFEAVDVAFYLAVLVFELEPTWFSLAFHLQGVLPAFLGHHHFVDIQFEQLTILLTTKAFVSAQTGKRAFAEAIEQTVDHWNNLRSFAAALHDLVIDY